MSFLFWFFCVNISLPRFSHPAGAKEGLHLHLPLKTWYQGLSDAEPLRQCLGVAVRHRIRITERLWSHLFLVLPFASAPWWTDIPTSRSSPIDFRHETQPKQEYESSQIYDQGKSTTLHHSIVDREYRPGLRSSLIAGNTEWVNPYLGYQPFSSIKSRAQSGQKCQFAISDLARGYSMKSISTSLDRNVQREDRTGFNFTGLFWSFLSVSNFSGNFWHAWIALQILFRLVHIQFNSIPRFALKSDNIDSLVFASFPWISLC
jgi:hypothetical protein